LLDIGCGWGALALHAARQHGVAVLGITLSEEQQRACQAKIAQFRFDDRVEVRLQDYRRLGKELFDRVASVGMMEHVGRSYLPAYMEAVARSLRPNGVGVFQTMGRTHRAEVTPWITKYIFPGMYLPTLAEVATEMARFNLHIVDVENLRPHYAITLDRWIERFENGRDKIAASFDSRFIRMWRMYLNSASAAFKYGDLNLWQITFTKGWTDKMPLTRRYMYPKRAK
jgi:cyclopropane-fatty-acyl-phospholipid synthase